MMEVHKPSLLLDASIFIFQYYFSLPENWASDEGYSTNAVYGYTAFLLRLLEEQRPRIIAACFDESLGSCFRNSIYPDYKCSRPPADEALAFQLQACREATELLGIASFSSREYEADDLLGSLSRLLRSKAPPIAILSRDKDLGQLLRREHDFLWDYSKKEKAFADGIHGKFGVYPHQLADYLALVGDSIDDIPGVPGLGPKTAQALLGVHESIDGIFSALDELHQLPIRGAKKLAEKLEAHAEQVFMARQLATIVETVPLHCNSSDLAWSEAAVDRDNFGEFCERMGFGRLAARAERLFDAMAAGRTMEPT